MEFKETLKSFLAAVIFCTATSCPYASGDCSSNVQPIKQGDVAPCSGFLFSDLAEKQAAQARDDAKFYEELSKKLTEKTKIQSDQNEILEKRLGVYIQQTDILSNHLGKKENTEGLYRGLYFLLGVAITGYIAANVNR